MTVFGIMSDKEPVSTARLFNRQIIPVFGACGVVVTDGGSEWETEFQELLIDSKIDHRTTTANHPQSNGLVERLVKTSKKALQKMLGDVSKSQELWDDLVPYIQLGIRERMQTELEIGDGPDKDAPVVARFLAERAQLMVRNTVMAGQNQEAQQRRDTLRYALLRGVASRQGSCGRTIVENAIRCAHCHLAIKDKIPLVPWM